MPPTLTKDQQEALDKFLQFMLSTEREFYLFGSAGSGKSFLVKELCALLRSKKYADMRSLLGLKPDYRTPFVCATTNKAAAVLTDFLKEPVDTVFAAFDIRVTEDFDTGTTKLFHQRGNQYADAVYFIDECSMLSQKALELIRKLAPRNSKLVFIGDNNQLAPVNEKPYWNNTKSTCTALLGTPVRNKDHKALMDLCNQLRTTVETRQFKDIQCVSGVIDHISEDEAVTLIQDFKAFDDIILSYTNERVDKCLEMLKELKPELRESTQFINATHYVTQYVPGAYEQRSPSIFPEEQVTCLRKYGPSVLDGIKDLDNYSIKVLQWTMYSPRLGAFLANIISPERQQAYLKQFAKARRWREYFHIKNGTMVLRLPHASTIHKSQGSTFNRVLIDLDSFKYCRDPETLARLLYVAVSRARSHVYFTGSLPKGFGRIRK